MYLSYVRGPSNNGTVWAGQMQNNALNSIFLPSQSSFLEIRGKTDDEFGSTTSESSSYLGVRTSNSESTVENVSQTVWTDPMMGSPWQCERQMPQVFLQPSVPQAYQQVSYGPQNCQNFPTSQAGAPIPGYMNMLPYQLQQKPITRSHSCPLQFPYVAYPVQIEQSLATAQNLPSGEDPMLYSPTPKTAPNSHQASSNFFANSVNTTPSLDCSNIPANFNSYGYVNSSMVQSTPCTPKSGVKSSVVPPTFHLTYTRLNPNIPDQISCNINPNPRRCALPKHEGTSTSVSDKIQVSTLYENDDENLWQGNCSYEDNTDNAGSNLFISWNGTESGLHRELQGHKLKIVSVSKCSGDGIFNVVFENHLSARKAFLTQRQIKMRMVPPKGSHRNWFRNPSPKFLVKFETRCRLVVKKGKADSHDTVGDLLMSSCQEQKGCIIWADQLKGHRIRVVSCEGKFMFPGGRVVQMRGVPTNSDRQRSLGWISYRCRHTRQLFVTRRSGNKLVDYIYTE